MGQTFAIVLMIIFSILLGWICGTACVNLRNKGGTSLGMAWRHFRTVRLHRRIVFYQCAKCGYFWRGLIHDLSKFSPVEFLPSAKYFQGNRSPIEAEKAVVGYSAAWLHHKGHNPHHWEYWTDFDENGRVVPCKIPYKYVVEMVCDWVGASIAYGKGEWLPNAPLNYYNSVRKGRHFHPETEKLILKFLNCISSYGLDRFHRLAKREKAAYELGYAEKEEK